MKVDSNISSAINKYIADSKRPAKDFAAKLGISEPALAKWRKLGKGITEPKWQILFPYIRKYLPNENIYIDDAGKERYASILEGVPAKYFEPKYIPKMLPCISFQAASKHTGMLDALDKFAKDMSTEKVEFHAKKTVPGGMLAVKIDNADWQPSLLPNTIMYIASKEYPENGDMVFAKTTDEKVFLAIYNDKGKTISIEPIPNSIKLNSKVEFPKTDARKWLLWIYPVVSYEVELRS